MDPRGRKSRLTGWHGSNVSAKVRMPFLLLPLLFAWSATIVGSALPERGDLMRRVAAGGAGTWRKVEAAAPDLSSRELFSCALAWCETGQYPERLERLFETAARMQDRDPASRGYGNFRWSWKHAVVFDFNAVDFCMRGGALLWLRHRDHLPAAARERLLPMLELGAEGCRRHKVRESYTNIALMNAGNLILLGEALAKPEFAREGYARLERVLLYTAQAGIHEFSSPTYYGVDLDDLGLIEAFCRDDRGRAQAQALLRLFWHDIALNFFPPGGRYAGPYSRNYDYLHGWGGIETHLFLHGWIDQPVPGGMDTVYSLLGRWSPPAGCRALADQYPRTVRQLWGPDPLQFRTHFLAPDITLGTAATGYGGRMDFLLTADLPGPRSAVRCYFVPDGRGDPYGTSKVPESAAAEAHSKALHLNPFWTAAQDRGEALALVVYRPGDVPAGAAKLESHLVMPLAARFSIGGKPVVLVPGQAASHPVAAGEAVVLRQGTAALGLRVPWANGAALRLVYDANALGAVRLTIDHRSASTTSAHPPAALLWLRAGSGLPDEWAFARWQAEFMAASLTLETGPARLAASLPAGVSLAAVPPFDQALPPTPARPQAVLEWNGKDVGGPLLREVEPLASAAAMPEAPVLRVVGDGGLRWEAEAGRILPFFQSASDPQASGGKFVWVPGEAGLAGSVDLGTVTWRLKLAAAGKFTLSARVKSPSPADDSVRIAVSAADGSQPLPVRDWPLGVHREWAWAALTDPATRRPQVLELPAGEVTVEIRPREDGTMLDQLELKPVGGRRPA
jgi:hypothetical protein